MASRYKHFLLALLLVSSAPFAQTQKVGIDPEKKQMIAHIMNITDAPKNFDAMKNQMMATIGNSSNPEAKEFSRRFSEKFNWSKISDVYTSIYDKHFSKSDLQGLINFYESPTGKKFIKELPGVMQESMQAGAALGQSTALEVQAEMAAEKAPDSSAK